MKLKYSSHVNDESLSLFGQYGTFFYKIYKDFLNKQVCQDLQN